MIDIKLIEKVLKEKILLLDGPMGTMIQEKKLDEEDFRGKKFLNSKLDEAKFITFDFLCFRGLRTGRASFAVVGSAPVSGLSPSQQDASAKGEKAWAAHVDHF